MKTALPWVVVVLLLGGVYFLFSANKAKEAEIARLTADSGEIENLRRENDDLKKQTVSGEELAKLRKDSEEALKLRAEAQRLNTQNKQLNSKLAALQAQQTQAQQAQQPLATENQSLRTEAQQAQQVQTLVQQQTDACINNLRQIEAAKQQWALENHKASTDIPAAADITPYLPKQVACPAGGTYNINAVNVPATCSVPGHVLK